MPDPNVTPMTPEEVAAYRARRLAFDAGVSDDKHHQIYALIEQIDPLPLIANRPNVDKLFAAARGETPDAGREEE